MCLCQAWAPNTVEIGGIHCREARQLPDDLRDMLDNHPEGVVYVSFGSTVKPSQMSEEKRQVFLETFSRLERPVIWKWDEDSIPGISDNVLIRQ